MKRRHIPWTLRLLLFVGTVSIMVPLGVLGWSGLLRWERAGLLALLALALLVLEIWCIRRWSCRPVERLEALLQAPAQTDPEELRRMALDVSGIAGPAARAALVKFEEMWEELDEIEASSVERAEREAGKRFEAEICESVLPGPIEDGRDCFALQGLVERGEQTAHVFYDYFFLDAERLVLLLAEAPGEDRQTALFLVTARAAVRSCLRPDCSLEEGLSRVNAKICDLGQGRTLRALLGLLQTEDGNFSFVDAGGCVPLLMRHEEHYELLDAPVLAALGENEVSDYRAVHIRLRQGDRLFFSTTGLRAVQDGDGTPFEKEQLRAVLDRSRSLGDDLGRMLRFVSDEAAAFCEREPDQPGYAALFLEYRRGRRELAHFDVPAQPRFAGKLTNFLKKQFEENAIVPQRYAKAAVVLDELFTLCCRRVGQGSLICLECGIAPDGGSVTLRMSAALSGQDPLEEPRTAEEESAVAFIQEQADFLSFQPGETGDKLTAVFFWAQDG